MANLDFTPLFRSTVGFDRLPQILSTAMRMEEGGWTYPPYNIEKHGQDRYRIVMAVAGFSKDDIEIVTEENRLIVRGKMKERDGADYLHRGIATRSFERRFDLAEFIEVEGATLENGLLTIELKRELPEEMRPRKIEIGTKTEKPKTIEHQAA